MTQRRGRSVDLVPHYEKDRGGTEHPIGKRAARFEATEGLAATEDLSNRSTI